MKDIKEINTDTLEGRLLLMAISKITGRYETNRTPDEALEDISKLADEVFNGEPSAPRALTLGEIPTNQLASELTKRGAKAIIMDNDE